METMTPSNTRLIVSLKTVVTFVDPIAKLNSNARNFPFYYIRINNWNGLGVFPKCAASDSGYGNRKIKFTISCTHEQFSQIIFNYSLTNCWTTAMQMFLSEIPNE